MHWIIYVLLFFFIPHQLSGQILPKEGSKLNYRLIGFSFPQIQDGTKCTLQIAKGYYNTKDSFNKNIIKSIDCTANKIIAEVPVFGSSYSWRVICASKRSIKNELHHFSTLVSPKIDTGITRLRIINEAQQYKDAYIFIDALQALYDMKGNPVWFLPDSGYSLDEHANVRDIKLSPQGTITFLTDGGNVYEINYNGNILWKGTDSGNISGDHISEHYHHEFTRLTNGHYMVLGSELVSWKLQGYIADSLAVTPDAGIESDSNNTFRQKMQFGTIIEYDEKGNAVWSWKSSEYFKGSGLYDHTNEKGRFDVIDVHANSFFFDEKTKFVYIGFRDISTILKVKYPDGKVMAVYGSTNKPGNGETGNYLFCGQHSVRISQDGCLYVFNNNSSQMGIPKLTMLQEPTMPNDSLKKVWEDVCSLDGMSDNEQKTYNKQIVRRQNENILHPSNHNLSAGGNVVELPDQSLFASTNGPFSKIFIVSRDKKMIWSAFPEQMLPNDSVWSAVITYRASILDSRKKLEQLIWNAETKKNKLPGGSINAER